MHHISYGCQTYPWQMNVKKFHGEMPHILSIISKTGYTGVEAEIVMLDSYYKIGNGLRRCLKNTASSLLLSRSTNLGCLPKKLTRKEKTQTKPLSL